MTDLAKLADEINRLHADAPGTKALAPNYRLVGLEGEYAVADALGVEYRPEVTGGDGGLDLIIRDVVGLRDYKVDAKTSRKPWLGMLCAIPLRSHIYVLVGYPSLKIFGWQWRSVVRQHELVDKGHGIMSHNVLPKFLRPLSELKGRIKRSEK